jgi:Uma2 family endonuclease
MAQPQRDLAPPPVERLITDDGEPMETARHRQQMTVLIESLEYAWQDRTDFYVGGNMFLYFSEMQVRNNEFRGPDVFVVTNTTRRERLAWVVWEEDGKTPDVIIELLSESTEHVDRGEKMHVYAQALKVGEYFLFDPWSKVFEGYELDVVRGRYVPKVPDEHGRLWCERLGLFLAKARSTLWAVDTEWLRWFDGGGRLLEMPIEAATAARQDANAKAERANAEAERANAEAERANAEAERAARLAEEIAALKRRVADEP